MDSRIVVCNSIGTPPIADWKAKVTYQSPDAAISPQASVNRQRPGLECALSLTRSFPTSLCRILQEVQDDLIELPWLLHIRHVCALW